MEPFDILQLSLILVTLAFAIFTIELKNLIYAVLSFSAMCITIGAIYWLLNAPYVALFQVLIYAGAIVTLFLAALTLTRLKESIK
jgi:NADH-quinone oxidoreductase subunit J